MKKKVIGFLMLMGLHSTNVVTAATGTILELSNSLKAGEWGGGRGSQRHG